MSIPTQELPDCFQNFEATMAQAPAPKQTNGCKELVVGLTFDLEATQPLPSPEEVQAALKAEILGPRTWEEQVQNLSVVEVTPPVNPNEVDALVGSGAIILNSHLRPIDTTAIGSKATITTNRLLKGTNQTPDTAPRAQESTVVYEVPTIGNLRGKVDELVNVPLVDWESYRTQDKLVKKPSFKTRASTPMNISRARQLMSNGHRTEEATCLAQTLLLHEPGTIAEIMLDVAKLTGKPFLNGDKQGLKDTFLGRMEAEVQSNPRSPGKAIKTVIHEVVGLLPTNIHPWRKNRQDLINSINTLKFLAQTPAN